MCRYYNLKSISTSGIFPSTLDCALLGTVDSTVETVDTTVDTLVDTIDTTIDTTVDSIVPTSSTVGTVETLDTTKSTLDCEMQANTRVGKQRGILVQNVNGKLMETKFCDFVFTK